MKTDNASNQIASSMSSFSSTFRSCSWLSTGLFSDVAEEILKKFADFCEYYNPNGRLHKYRILSAKRDVNGEVKILAVELHSNSIGSGYEAVDEKDVEACKRFFGKALKARSVSIASLTVAEALCGKTHAWLEQQYGEEAVKTIGTMNPMETARCEIVAAEMKRLDAEMKARLETARKSASRWLCEEEERIRAEYEAKIKEAELKLQSKQK